MTRFVATSDTHFPWDPDMIPSGDVFIHAGDLLYRGTPDEWDKVLPCMRAMPHSIKIFVPGNHDFYVENYTGVAISELRRAGFITMGLNRPTALIGDVKVLASPYVTGLYGWAFNRDEAWLYDNLHSSAQGETFDLVISHAPPHRTLDDVQPESTRRNHVGGRAARKWFDSMVARGDPPKAWIHGHIHESYGRKTIDGCTFYNVAMCDREYQQVNPPMVFDI